MSMNAERADAAQVALDAFPWNELVEGENLQLQNIGDLIADLFHLAKREGVEDMQQFADGCVANFDIEVAEEDGERGDEEG